MLVIQQMKANIIFRRKRVQEGSWGKGGWRTLHGVAVSCTGKDYENPSQPAHEQKSGFMCALSRSPHGLEAGQSQYSFVVKIMGSGIPRPGFILFTTWASILGIVSLIKRG